MDAIAIQDAHLLTISKNDPAGVHGLAGCLTGGTVDRARSARLGQIESQIRFAAE
ncbi:hypothetical protein [Streptomyces sp. NBC_00233]|uniref:hypothetical protein n=1 Tax=Streptomyces sp. NBC_00233 TaxID=2975686 RepID=UPI00225A82F0|nr:hypothetical protein [Streptomyces sp. NBC_00233]MCX5233453.1 hypothetical protein [Streptomyces sp. NBC_00233]